MGIRKAFLDSSGQSNERRQDMGKAANCPGRDARCNDRYGYHTGR